MNPGQKIPLSGGNGGWEYRHGTVTFHRLRATGLGASHRSQSKPKEEGGTLLDIVTRVRRVEDDLWSGRRSFTEAGALRRKAIQEAIDNGHHFHEIAAQLRIHPEDVQSYAGMPRL
jgi:hypothetical protein